jgi:hypothetical protein
MVILEAATGCCSSRVDGWATRFDARLCALCACSFGRQQEVGTSAWVRTYEHTPGIVNVVVSGPRRVRGEGEVILAIARSTSALVNVDNW